MNDIRTTKKINEAVAEPIDVKELLSRLSFVFPKDAIYHQEDSIAKDMISITSTSKQNVFTSVELNDLIKLKNKYLFDLIFAELNGKPYILINLKRSLVEF